MVVQVLIERGADIFKKTSDGSLPGDIAYVNGKERVCLVSLKFNTYSVFVCSFYLYRRIIIK